MANYREILRLSSLGFNHTQIAKSADCSRTTVINVLQLAKEKELKYPLPKDMSDKALYEALFPSAAGKPKYKMPDYEHVYKELQRDGVTLDLLWREKVYVFVATLPYSGYSYVEGFFSMDQECWTSAHVNAFKYFGGVTKMI